jgi:hypothetical protein
MTEMFIWVKYSYHLSSINYFINLLLWNHWTKFGSNYTFIMILSDDPAGVEIFFFNTSGVNLSRCGITQSLFYYRKLWLLEPRSCVGKGARGIIWNLRWKGVGWRSRTVFYYYCTYIMFMIFIIITCILLGQE